MALVLEAGSCLQLEESHAGQRNPLPGQLMAFLSGLFRSVYVHAGALLSAEAAHETMGSSKEAPMKREHDPGRTPEGLIPDEQLPRSLSEGMELDPDFPAASMRAGRRPGPPSPDAITSEKLEQGAAIDPDAQDVLDTFLKHLRD
jgi:hypothetical protein